MGGQQVGPAGQLISCPSVSSSIQSCPYYRQWHSLCQRKIARTRWKTTALFWCFWPLTKKESRAFPGLNQGQDISLTLSCLISFSILFSSPLWKNKSQGFEKLHFPNVISRCFNLVSLCVGVLENPHHLHHPRWFCFSASTPNHILGFFYIIKKEF